MKTMKALVTTQITIIFISIFGYVHNILNIVDALPEGPISNIVINGLFITQALGVVIPPLGVVMGLFVW
jgi:hypothetical protein